MRSMLLSLLACLYLAGPGYGQASDLTIDPTKAEAPISPYIYGQFVEHLGRCIHGGIWAEMLRDRKFLQEPGKAWQPVATPGLGPQSSVVFLDPAGAYAGDHCMAVWTGNRVGARDGIRQGGLALVAGHEYTGHAVLANIGKAAPVEVRLSWGDRPDAGRSVVLSDVGSAYHRFRFRFRAGASTDSGAFTLTTSWPAFLWIGCVSLMPADNDRGMRSDVMALIRKLAPPITRWPGGNFVSGYDWKDGIGERDRRPPRWERAWSDVEDNDFGIDEFMAFCAAARTEPYIAVNAGLGSAEQAAEEVQYANGSAGTPWGAKRAANGHRQPYAVRWWGVGNEMFGDWQLGHVPVERYTARQNEFVRAMRARDAGIKVVAVGAPGPWNDAILSSCSAGIDLLSGHHYTERRFRMPLAPPESGRYEDAFHGYSGSVARGITGIILDLRRRQGKGNGEVDRIKLAIDEWGIVRDWNPAPDGPGIGPFEHYYCLGDAIAAARALNVLLRNADIVAMANWAQTVNVIGAIKTNRAEAVLDPVGHVLALYRARVSGRIVPLAAPDGLTIDAVAAWDSKTRLLSVALVNYSAAESGLGLRLAGPVGQSAAGWRIAGPFLGAINVPGQPEAVSTTALLPVSLVSPVALPPYSITVLQIGYRGKP